MADYKINRDNDVDYFLIHQANKMIVDRIVKKLKLPLEKVPYNLEEFGNLGGASIPSLMVTRLREQLMTAEKSLLMSSFGLGLGNDVDENTTDGCFGFDKSKIIWLSYLLDKKLVE